jgi:predicted Zn finger-like uncharacterized protein
MKVSCPSCDAKYNIADDKVKGKKVKVRCKTCGSQILVDGTATQVSTGTGSAQRIETSPGTAASSSTPAPAPAASDAWTVNFSDTDERTLTTAEIIDMAVHGRLGSEVFVWKDGMGDWSLVANVPELASAIDTAKKKAPAAFRTTGSSKAVGGAGGSRSNAPPPAQGAGAAKSTAKKPLEFGKGSQAKDTVGSSPPPADEGAPKVGPIVAAPGSALAKKLASAKGATAAQKSSAGAELAKGEAAEGEPAHKKSSTESAIPHKSASEQPPAPKAATEAIAAPKAATKLATKRQAGAHDLFAAVDKAGSEIDVDTSDVEEHDTAARTGARNENSVLFSLDALKSGLGGGAGSKPTSPFGSQKKGPAAPSKRLEDLMTVDMPGPAFGGSNTMAGGGLLLSGNDALLAAPPPPPPKPEPRSDFAMQASLGGDFGARAPKKQRLGLIIGLTAAMAALGAGGAVFALKSGSHDSKPVASTAAPSAAATVSALASASAAPSAASAASASAKNDVADAATTGAASAAVAAAKAGGRAPTSKSGADTKADTKATDKKPETKSAEPSQAVASGSFNTDAAKAQLAMMASQSTVCKRPEGPWGTGRAVITFASSGRVTTANVTGDPFGGTAVGGCVANVFRRAKIPPFSGDSVTVSKSFTIAP